MRRKSFAHDKRAVSAVIATVIIVAVTIAIAIAVAYWMGGLATIFTRFEKIEVKSAFVKKTGTTPPLTFNITITYINTGATATTIDLVTINGVPLASFSPIASPGGSLLDNLTCPTGVTRVGWISFTDGTSDPSGNVLTGGVTATVDLHTTGGKDYYNSVTLP